MRAGSSVRRATAVGRHPRAGARARVVVALVPALLAAGCVHQSAPGVKVMGKESNVVFGLPPTPAAAPPGAAPTLEPPVTPDLGPAGTLPTLPASQIPVLPPAPAPGPRRPDLPFCRAAGPGDFDKAAPTGVGAPPAKGVYDYKPTAPELRDGSSAWPVSPTDIVRRQVANVSPVMKASNVVNGLPSPAGDGTGTGVTQTFTYELQTFLNDGSVRIDKYRVVDNGIREVVGSNVGPTVYAGQVDRGISLEAVQIQKPAGRVVRSFAPATPVLLLPLPAVPGQIFQSAAVDPVNGAAYSVYGTIRDRQDVDACGDVVSSWSVDAQTLFTDPSNGGAPSTATWTYGFATGLGGLPAFEQLGPLTAPAIPLTGTPADQALPKAPAVPDLPTTVKPSQLSLARKAPEGS